MALPLQALALAADDRLPRRLSRLHLSPMGAGREVIPYGISETFRAAEPAASSPRRAIFVSNPLRSLDWLLEVWAAKIRPRVADAELHLFTGAVTYGEVGDAK